MLLAIASPVSAQVDCAFCNATVRLDEALATCFETELPKHLAVAPTTGDFTVINLASCGEEIRTRSGLPVELREGQNVALLDASFVVSQANLECLGKAIAARNKPLAEPHVYVLAEICP